MAGDAEVGFGVGAVFLKYGDAGVRLDAEAVKSTMTASLDDFDARFSGDSNQSGAGEAIGAGDVNGDGVDDLVITAPKYDNRRGIVYVMPGANTANYSGEWSLWDADVRLRGNEEGDALGRTLSVVRGADTSRDRVGVDGDDIADLWVGAAGQNPSEAAFLVNGSIANFNDTIGNVSALGMFPLASYSKSQVTSRDAYDGHITVGTLGDINGDKYVDVVASFPWYSEYADGNQNGVAAIFLGGGE